MFTLFGVPLFFPSILMFGVGSFVLLRRSRHPRSGDTDDDGSLALQPSLNFADARARSDDPSFVVAIPPALPDNNVASTVDPTVQLAVFARDHFTCAGYQAVGVDLRLHHVVPPSLGGLDAPSNLVTLCQRCYDLLHSAS
jgi:hypothetical protein